MLTHFAIRLICGISLMIVAIPHKTIASGFFRVQMLIILGFSVLAGLANGAFLPVGMTDAGLTVAVTPASGIAAGSAWLTFRPVLAIILGIEAFLASILWTLERRVGASRLLLIILATGLLALGLSAKLINPGLQTSVLSLWGSEFASIMLLGGALTGMLLGHSYLTTPTMSIAPLSLIAKYFLAGGIVRAGVSAWGLSQLTLSTLQTESIIWLSLRWGAGILAPILLSVMTLQILRYRNTQAATGVLFVGVIVTFIGELVAALLQQMLHLPL